MNREARFLVTRYRSILYYTGTILGLGGGCMLTTLLAWPFFSGQTDHARIFLPPAFSMLVIWLASRIFLKPKEQAALTVQEGGVIVLLGWILVTLFSAWPFMSGLGFTFTQAVFESVSGWTTTGLSVVDVTHANPFILLWRSIMQLAGGAGLAVIMMAAITGPSGPGVTAAEGRGDQLEPQVRRSAKIVLYVYMTYTIVGVAAYGLFGMPWFDAVNHAFAAVSTGGFSTQVESIGHYDSTLIEAVTIVLMVFGNLSFVTAWQLRYGRFRIVGQNGEVRVMAVLLPISVALLFCFVSSIIYPTWSKGLRVAVFEAVTALTTTGFSTVSYNNWPPLGIFVIIVLMVIGGGACSTAGALKQFRIHLLFRFLIRTISRPLGPRNSVVEDYVWEGSHKRFIGEQDLNRVASFSFLYILGLVLGTAILAAHGFGIAESLFEYASAQGTVGLSLGLTSPTAPVAVLWTETFGMLLGRLEFIVVLVSLVKLWKDVKIIISRRAGRNPLQSNPK